MGANGFCAAEGGASDENLEARLRADAILQAIRFRFSL
jgi:hypothetical protein